MAHLVIQYVCLVLHHLDERLLLREVDLHRKPAVPPRLHLVTVYCQSCAVQTVF